MSRERSCCWGLEMPLLRDTEVHHIFTSKLDRLEHCRVLVFVGRWHTFDVPARELEGDPFVYASGA